MKEVMRRLQEVFRDVFDNETMEISPETIIRELDGWDSLVHVTLMAAVQEEFGVTYNVEDLSEINTVDDILRSIGGAEN